MCDDSPLRRPQPGQPRGLTDRLRADELIDFAPGHAGVLAIPEGATAEAPAPIIVVAPERYGLVQHTVDIVERFAAHGWAAVSPDFYIGMAEDEAGRLPALSDAHVMSHVDAAVEHLAKDPRVDRTRVVVFGVCKSGSWGLVAAAKHPEVAGVIMLYGGAQDREYVIGENRPEAYADIIKASKAPILGIYGEKDHSMSVDQVRALRNLFEESNRSYRMSIVKDMPHGWLNDTMPQRFFPEAAESTWTEMLTFLDEVLAGTAADQVAWEFKSIIDADYDFTKNVRLG